jgi:hypothetical protein
MSTLTPAKTNDSKVFASVVAKIHATFIFRRFMIYKEWPCIL